MHRAGFRALVTTLVSDLHQNKAPLNSTITKKKKNIRCSRRISNQSHQNFFFLNLEKFPLSHWKSPPPLLGHRQLLNPKSGPDFAALKNPVSHSLRYPISTPETARKDQQPPSSNQININQLLDIVEDGLFSKTKDTEEYPSNLLVSSVSTYKESNRISQRPSNSMETIFRQLPAGLTTNTTDQEVDDILRKWNQQALQ